MYEGHVASDIGETRPESNLEASTDNDDLDNGYVCFPQEIPVLEAAPQNNGVVSTPSLKRGREREETPSPKKFESILGGKVLTLQLKTLRLIEETKDDMPVTNKRKIDRPLGRSLHHPHCVSLCQSALGIILALLIRTKKSCMLPCLVVFFPSNRI